MKKKVFKIAYVSAFLLLFALPGIVSLFRKNNAIGNEEKKNLDGATYTSFSDRFDDYFSTGFGFRNELVDINNSLKYAIFKQSGAEDVIVGRDGWFFYQSALHDYIGKSVLSDSKINRIVKILSMTAEYANSQGVDFIFVAPPNKMEIYGDKMPYYYREDASDGNYEKLFEGLASSNVKFVDLKNVLRDAADKSDDIIYHKEDSHWNNLGASVAYNSIMDALNKESTDYSSLDYSFRQDFKGDLYAMLFPNKNHKDMQAYFDMPDRFYYTSNFKGNDDIIIKSQNDDGQGNLVMFRDSFGNALHTFFANDFEQAMFTRALPYDMINIGNADTVVVELVERNLKNILLYQPVIDMKLVEEPTEAMHDTELEVRVYEEDGKVRKYANSKIKIIISSNKLTSDCINMYIKTADNKVYEAYPSENTGEACIYINETQYYNGYIAELLYTE